MLYKCKFNFSKCYAKITHFLLRWRILMSTFAYEQARKPINSK